MGAQLVNFEGSQVTLKVTIDLSCSLLTSEEIIQQSLNEAGCIATEAALKYLVFTVRCGTSIIRQCFPPYNQHLRIKFI
jgi:hypothetical protein